jgi:hypothetical protein
MDGVPEVFGRAIELLLHVLHDEVVQDVSRPDTLARVGPTPVSRL